MKKFIITMSVLVVLTAAGLYAYYGLGVYMDLHPNVPVTTFMSTNEDTIYMLRDGEYQPFEIRGVDMGVGIPGEWATDFAIDKETYLRWFQYIQELGANTVRVYTILHDDFYNAFYEYNTAREEAGEEPLWLLHGVWVDDYSHNSHKDMYDEGLLPEMIQDCKTIIDILHGRKFLLGRDGDGSGFYSHDVSRWVLGYILGVEWETSLVTYTNQNNPRRTSYQGTYMATTQDATPFEAALAQLGDEVIRYENFGGYNPMEIFNNDPDIRRVLMQLINGTFAPYDTELFRPLYNSLLNTQSTSRADMYFILKDFKPYAEAQRRIEAFYRDEKAWARSAILNVACSGKFSSDRTIQEYVDDIWHLDKVVLPKAKDKVKLF